MGSISNPKTWVPYMNTKDCSKGFCSLYCPQWCYIIFPPPPPIEISTDDDSPSPNFSPLVIAIIGILASALLLVSYYTIISRYCGTSRRRRENQVSDVEAMGDNYNPSGHDHAPWQASSTGLDEALIKSIAVFKYKKCDTDDHGLTQGTDCSVCLNEFQEDESLRLLPKCNHAFHVQCIDTWLKSHSNCPLCRANIVFVTAPAPPPVTELQTPPSNEEALTNGNVSRALSDLSSLQGRDVVIRVREESYDHQQMMRRSVSMDHLSETQGSVADVLHKNYQEGSSKQSGSSKMSTLQFPAAMKRSFSSGRFFLARQGRVRDLSIPL